MRCPSVTGWRGCPGRSPAPAGSAVTAGRPTRPRRLGSSSSGPGTIRVSARREEGRRRRAAEIRQVLARREQALACRRQEAVARADPAMAWHGLREAGYIDGLTHATRGLSGDIETVLRRWGL